MSWERYAASRQHIAEEEYGKHVRAAHKAERAKFERTAANLRRQERRQGK